MNAQELADVMRLREKRLRAARDPWQTDDVRSHHATEADRLQAIIKAAPREVYEAARALYAGPVTETDD